MLFEVTIVAVIVGYVLRGRLVNLAEAQVKGLFLAVLVVAAQYGSQYAADLGLEWIRNIGPYIYIASLLLLLAVIWMNRQNPALVLLGVGIFLNALAITVNGGKMPVSLDALESLGLPEYADMLRSGRVITHQPLTPEARLAFLTDVIVFPRPYLSSKVISIGDIVLALGALWYLVGGMIAHPSVTGRRRAAEVTRLTTPL